MVNIKKLNKAVSHTNNKDFESAENIYYELLREHPNDDVVLSFWGMFNMKKGSFSKAEKILESVYKIKKSPSTIAALAHTKFKLRKFDDAIILYEELFRYDKDSEIIYQKIIQCFNSLGMYNFADAYCQKYISAHPDSRHALSLMTQNYMNTGEYKKAEEYCARTMELYPDNPSTWVNAGLLQELFYNNEEVAQECYKKAIENKDPQAFYYLAVSLQKTGRHAEAEHYYQKALEFFPEDKDVWASLGCLYLSERKFNQGYQYFIKREESREIKSLKNRWYGEGDNGVDESKTILVYFDQGLGDGIQYSRYLPFLNERFSKVIAYTRSPLKNLLMRNFPKIVFTDTGLSELKYDMSILSADIPYYLGMDFSDIPAASGYLVPDEEKVSEYKTKYFNTDKLKVGLCWKAGDMAIRSAINRTINIEYFQSLFELKNVEFYSFQKDDIFDAIAKYPQINDIAKDLETLDDTAAAIKNLDLMISADTVCIHIAGALGIKSKLMIPYCPDWRWFDNTNKTEWYSSVGIIKQTERQDWFNEVEILKEFITGL